MRVCHSDTEKCPLSVLTGVRILNGLILEKIYDIFVGPNETVRNIRVSVLSGCQ